MVPPFRYFYDSNIACFFFQVGRSVLLGRSWRDTDSEDSHIKSALLFTLDRGEVIFFCCNWDRDSVIEAAIISSFLFIMSFVFWIFHWGGGSFLTNEWTKIVANKGKCHSITYWSYYKWLLYTYQISKNWDIIPSLSRFNKREIKK